jgi:hypothetical protein
MTKKRVFDVPGMALNIMAVLAQATDDEKAVGMAWYQVALDFCLGLSARNGVRPWTTAAVTATLSPACKWVRNMVDAENLTTAYCIGGAAAAWRVSCCTYGPNKAKAIGLLDGTVLEVTGQKVVAFHYCILNPSNTDVVVIDRHAWNVCVADRFIRHDKHSVDAAMSVAASDAYRQVAKMLNILPLQAQAIAWTTWRRMIGESD